MADLVPVQFTLEMLPAVKSFRCGDQLWQQEVAKWIRGEKVPQDLKWSLKRGARVWLYVDTTIEDETGGAAPIVGFGSLGTTGWPYPTPADSKKRVAIIPNFAVDERYKRRGYGTQIIGHIRAQATNEGFGLLGLFVHEDNFEAIPLYQHQGFTQIGIEGNYIKMLQLLDPAKVIPVDPPPDSVK